MSITIHSNNFHNLSLIHLEKMPHICLVRLLLFSYTKQLIIQKNWNGAKTGLGLKLTILKSGLWCIWKDVSENWAYLDQVYFQVPFSWSMPKLTEYATRYWLTRDYKKITATIPMKTCLIGCPSCILYDAQRSKNSTASMQKLFDHVLYNNLKQNYNNTSSKTL